MHLAPTALIAPFMLKGPDMALLGQCRGTPPSGQSISPFKLALPSLTSVDIAAGVQ